MAQTMNIKEYYDSCAEFKEYVDEYCKDRGITAEEALTHYLVLEVGLHYFRNTD
jgi:hypothetical protein